MKTASLCPYWVFPCLICLFFLFFLFLILHPVFDMTGTFPDTHFISVNRCKFSFPFFLWKKGGCVGEGCGFYRSSAQITAG